MESSNINLKQLARHSCQQIIIYTAFMEQTTLPTWSQVCGWLNATISLKTNPITDLKDLVNGEAYLSLLHNIFPSQKAASLDFRHSHPSSKKIKRNFKEVKTILIQKLANFPFDISILVLPSHYEHFLLCLFLYQAFSPKDASGVKQLKDKRQNMIKTPKTSMAVNIQKGVHAQVTLAELQSLHSKGNLNNLLPKIQTNLNVKVLNISAQKPQEKNCDRKIVQTILMPIDSIQEGVQKNLFMMPFLTSKKLYQSFTKTFKITNSQRFFLYLRSLTINFLQKIPELSLEEQEIIQKFSKRSPSFSSFIFLFFENQGSESTKNHLRKYCRNYYRSIDFLKVIVGNFHLKMKAKLLFIVYLVKYEMLASKLINFQDFLRPPKDYIDISLLADQDWEILQEQPFCKEKDLNSSSSTMDQSCRDFDKSQALIPKEQQFKVSDSIKKENQSLLKLSPFKEIETEKPQYWSIHMATLIAFELQYVKTKDPKYDHQDLTHRFLTEHTNFVTGLLIARLKVGEIIDTIEFISQSDAYPKLKKYICSSANTSEARLGKLLKAMLSIKHSFIVGAFVQAYQKILTEIEDVSFANVKTERKRIEVVEGVVRKLDNNITQIAAMVKEALQLEKVEDASELMRATVYCFLAEYFAFPINEYWQKAFFLLEQQIDEGKKKVYDKQ